MFKCSKVVSVEFCHTCSFVLFRRAKFVSMQVRTGDLPFDQLQALGSIDFVEMMAFSGEPRFVGLYPASPVTELNFGDNVGGNTWFQSTIQSCFSCEGMGQARGTRTQGREHDRGANAPTLIFIM